MLKVHEVTTSDGTLRSVYLRVEGATLALVEGDLVLALPDGALAAVMAKYGAPLDPSERVTNTGELELGHGSVLRSVRHLAGYDVIARDYLVYEVDGCEPSCALATTVTGALEHLGRRASSLARP